MTEHTIEVGRSLIDGLATLGTALGYAVDTEWPIPGGTAAVDVVWLKRPGDIVPLLAFEVETTAGAGLASNAVKILGRDASTLRKPLHLFHIVAGGGERSQRPNDVATTFAGHNYSIHLLSERDAPRDLLAEIFSVHQRVSDHVDGFVVGMALRHSAWPQDETDVILQRAEQAGIRGLNEACYARLAAADPTTFRSSLTRSLIALWQPQLQRQAQPPNRYIEPEQPREEPYGSYMAFAAGEVIELGLIAALEPIYGAAALDVLEQWQAINHIGDRLGPYTGAGMEWTAYIVGNFGYLWALIAALTEDVPGARRWCAEQAASLLEAVYGATHPDVLLLAAWTMHLAATSDTADIYELALAKLQQGGGLSAHWLAQPEPSAPGEDGDWSDILRPPLVAPDLADLVTLVRSADSPERTPIDLALAALIEDPVFRPSDGAAVAAHLAK